MGVPMRTNQFGGEDAVFCMSEMERRKEGEPTAEAEGGGGRGCCRTLRDIGCSPYGDAEPAEHALGVRGVRELQWLSEAPMWYVFLLEEWQKAAEPAHEGRGRGSIRPPVAL